MATRWALTAVLAVFVSPRALCMRSSFCHDFQLICTINSFVAIVNKLCSTLHLINRAGSALLVSQRSSVSRNHHLQHTAWEPTI